MIRISVSRVLLLLAFLGLVACGKDSEPVETIEEAAKLMQDWQIKHLPVTDKGKLVGMITYLDIAFNVPALLPAMKKLYTQ